ncbi:N-6 DNA methylase [Bradyrhizobium sp. CER78]|uniref:HsdM family class I SAM-dependent methyltransferase n=1 Tax=Bradyrhizobium sp. CER78 TaxID=3039162 RepID=UPI00244997D1|nr:N-6 DNA methylase [Bradyrhizobium sp. CER78]MDH2384728.1 N-6 DNA methylase [Bradyrhizobium sp. CER78]
MNEIIERYGGDPSSIRSFELDGPELLPYATLHTARTHSTSDFTPIAAVYEWDKRPLIILVDGNQVRGSSHLNAIRRAVAMRGDAPYLGVIQLGRLTIYTIALDDRSIDQALIPLALDLVTQSRALIPHLGNTRPIVSPRHWISDVVLRLLTGTIDAIIGDGLADEDAISLVGRALFVRFLADRSLLQAGTLPKQLIDPASSFDTREGIATITRWLDKTFNGDFLPLTPGLVKQLPDATLLRLGDLLRSAPGGQLYLGWQEKWDRLDFAHIPVGVLSQAYERYLSRHDPLTQRLEGGYYTPRHIADLMISASFAALEDDGRAADARVLDPAAGAGVFLITAFRQLVAQHWRAHNKRPDTTTLRAILRNQITGFDINESALRFAALGLYLISIELDPNPEPIEKLRFDNLRPQVLRKVEAKRRTDRVKERRKTSKEASELGSLGPDVGLDHLGAYDLVIGNPPWASSTRLQGWHWLQEHVNEIARDRAQDDSLVAPLPNEVLDLPFVWRSLEWAKPGAQIAFALHARLLFQQGETMPGARDALFRCLDITGVINGTEIRNTRVWPEISAPFCLLFARNRAPSPGSGFRFVTPRLESRLNQAGAWRIDVTNSETVAIAEARSRPTLLKTLFRGSRLDAEALDRIESHGWPSLEQYWIKLFGEHRGKSSASGNGFQRIRRSSRVRKNGDGLPGVSAEYLHGVPLADADDDLGVLVESRTLTKFNEPRIHDPRPLEIFRGPLLLVRESPPVRNGRMKVSLAESDIVYSQSFHGYSAQAHPERLTFSKYIALLIGSKVALWRALLTSGRFGFEREVVEKFIIDEIPIKPFEELDGADKVEIESLFSAVAAEKDDAGWCRVDNWVASLYKLQDSDLECIDDTLRLNLPFAENRRLSQAPPSDKEVEHFCVTLGGELAEWRTEARPSLTISMTSRPPLSPWRFVRIAGKPSRAGPNDPLEDGLIQAANVMAATEIVLVDEGEDCLWLGRLDQSRYWSRSQARLAARHIVWEHSSFLSGRT